MLVYINPYRMVFQKEAVEHFAAMIGDRVKGYFGKTAPMGLPGHAAGDYTDYIHALADNYDRKRRSVELAVVSEVNSSFSSINLDAVAKATATGGAR